MPAWQPQTRWSPASPAPELGRSHPKHSRRPLAVLLGSISRRTTAGSFLLQAATEDLSAAAASSSPDDTAVRQIGITSVKPSSGLEPETPLLTMNVRRGPTHAGFRLAVRILSPRGSPRLVAFYAAMRP